MKKILLIPSDHGGGRGHVSRCIYLAKKLQASGHSTAIVLEKKHYRDGLEAGLKTILFNSYAERIIKYQFKKPFKPYLKLKNRPTRRPVFLQFSSLAYQVPRDGYLSEKIVRHRLKSFEKIINSFKPDVLIGDTHFLTYLLGQKHQIPVIQITRYAGFPPRPKFLWWQLPDDTLTEPDALKPFEPVIEKLALNDVSRPEHLLRGSRYIVPANKTIEPLRVNDPDVIYGGPLNEITSLNRPIPFFKEESAYPKIYVSIGGGAARSEEMRLFNRLLEIFNKTEYRVLISTARRVPAKSFSGKSANVLFVDWIDGMSAIRQSDLVIYHGGYGTTMEVLMASRPSIVIPSHSEQEGNGQRLRKNQIGELVYCHGNQFEPLTFLWTYGEFNMNAAYNFSINENEMLEKTQMLLYSSVYERLARQADSLRKLQDAFDLRALVDF